MTTLTIPATYYKGVIFPTKKISPKQLDSYTITISLTPKTKKADSGSKVDQLVQEGLDAFDRGEYIKGPKKPSGSSISKLLRN